MNPAMLALLGPVTTILVAVIGTLFARAVFARLDEIASDLKAVKGKVDSHAERLAKLEAVVEMMARWKEKFDDRRGAA